MDFNYLEPTGKKDDGVCEICAFNRPVVEIGNLKHAAESTIWVCAACGVALDHPDLAVGDAKRYGRLLHEARKYGFMVNRLTEEVRSRVGLDALDERPPLSSL